MSYWSHHPELYDELCTNNLPEPWKEKVESGEIELQDVPEDILTKAYSAGEQDHWDSLASQAEYHPHNDSSKEKK